MNLIGRIPRDSRARDRLLIGLTLGFFEPLCYLLLLHLVLAFDSGMVSLEWPLYELRSNLHYLMGKGVTTGLLWGVLFAQFLRAKPMLRASAAFLALYFSISISLYIVLFAVDNPLRSTEITWTLFAARWVLPVILILVVHFALPSSIKLLSICRECGQALPPHCHHCGYDRRGDTSDRCPECGVANSD
jgi:uncharacterized integral membrane protein